MNQYYSQVSWLADEQAISKFSQKGVAKYQHLLSGGYESITYNGYPTGLIKISSAEARVIRKSVAGRTSSRLSYMQKVLAAPYISDAPQSLLHLNSYKKVESFNDYSDLEVETLINYGFPAIYCSCLDSKNKSLSDCSEDIVLDRLRMGSVYNRGIKFDIKNNDAFFFIDRKAATLFRTQHLKAILQKDTFSILAPSQDSIRFLGGDLISLISKLSNTKEPTLFLERIIDFNRKHPFSTVSSAMFELTHYWLNQHTQSVVVSNRIMQDIDPGLKKHWTMRGYSLGSSANVADVFDGRDLSFGNFADYIKASFLEELSQYYGDNQENLYDLALDNIFYAKINQLETVASLDPSTEAVDSIPRIPAELKDFLYYDEDEKRIVFEKAITGLDNLGDLLMVQGNQFLVNHLYKLVYIHVKESIGAEVLRIIKLNKLGYVATTLQPDNRGEYFLLASISDESVNARRVHIGIEDEQATFTELDPIDVSFAIKTYADFDPTLNYFLPENNILSLKTTRAKRFMQVYKAKESYVADIFSIYYAPKVNRSKKQIVAAFPFFKEREVLIENINEFISSHEAKGDLHVLLISNLTQSEFDVLISKIEVKIGSSHRGSENIFLYPINTAEINAINLWMSNKILCFMLGTYFTDFLIQEGLGVDRFYMIESDIFNSKSWWTKYSREQVGRNDLLLLKFIVYARSEAEAASKEPLLDIKENVFYELFEKPLMQVFHGGFSGVITGSSYCFGPEAVKKVQYSIKRSLMVQSIEWHLLNTKSLLNIRQLEVDKKIHYTSSVIDDRFGHRILGLFEGLLENYQHLLLSRINGNDDVTFGINGDLPQVLDGDYYTEVREQAIKISSYFDGVYSDVLGKDEFQKIMNSLVNNSLTFDQWIKVLLVYFKTCQGKPQGVVIELLNSLQPLSVLAFGCLMGEKYQTTKESIEATLKGLEIINKKLKQETRQIVNIKTEATKRQFIISDIHGEYGLLCDAMSKLGLLSDGIIKMPKGSSLVIAGDMLDCYSGVPLDEAGRILHELVMDSSVQISEIEEALQVIVGQKEFRLSEESLSSIDMRVKKELINAYKSYKVLKLIWQSYLFNNENSEYGNVVALLGNHEVDLLNGRLFYCSLQKSFLLNMLGVGGAHELEFKAFKEGKAPLYSTGEIAKYIERPHGYIHLTAMLSWLANQPIGASMDNILIMHSGPTKTLMSRIDEGSIKNKYEADRYLSGLRDTALTADDIYFLPSIFDFRTEVDTLVSGTRTLRPFLSMYGCEFLAIGHSPYLNFQVMGMPTDKETLKSYPKILHAVGMINDTVVKVDSGLKEDPVSVSLLVVFDDKLSSFSTSNGIEAIYDFKTGLETSAVDIRRALGVANLIERIKT
ncbi:MAG TPA: hypothetical protein VJ843_04160 [Candidatus Saccharimonadales bacterium]|nr:hypothetical protein [Candidatus Saccharimonadales bacterium]